MVVAELKGRKTMSSEFSGKVVRRVKISKQRQINIPKEFYEALGLEDEALIEFTGKELTIKPAESEVVDFSGDILKDLVNQGFEGQDLLEEFHRVKANIPRALDLMKKEALQQPSISPDHLDDYLDSLEDEEQNEWKASR